MLLCHIHPRIWSTSCVLQALPLGIARIHSDFVTCCFFVTLAHEMWLTGCVMQALPLVIARILNDFILGCFYVTFAHGTLPTGCVLQALPLGGANSLLAVFCDMYQEIGRQAVSCRRYPWGLPAATEALS